MDSFRLVKYNIPTELIHENRYNKYVCIGKSIIVSKCFIRESHLEDCMEKCKEHPSCNFFTLEKQNDHCILYEDCDVRIDCETCASGAKYCSLGYHGNHQRLANVEQSKRALTDSPSPSQGNFECHLV